MRQNLRSTSEAAKLIASGRKLLLAGDEGVLRGLPAGNWVAGSIPYFMAAEGGVCARDRVFVTELPDCVGEVTMRFYDGDELRNVYRDAPSNGLTVVIIPAGTAVHQAFAVEAPAYPGFGTRPLVGWIAGVHLDELGSATPKVFLGSTGAASTDKAVVLHMTLPREKSVNIGIVNLFKQGDGDLLSFPDTGFKVTTVLVNDEPKNLAAYIKERSLDTTLPFVADYGGASINVSVQSVDHDKGVVTLYAPVFSGIIYKHAQPVGDYVTEFTAHLPKDMSSDMVFSCNCILNYLYSHLEGRSTGEVTGPVTFGEIAYQLLNQTLAYVTLIDVAS